MRSLQRLTTGIEGLDHLSLGGLPEGRTTLVSGTAGSGKTVLAIQFLAEGIRQFGQAGVFVTFEESPEEIRLNAASLGFDIEALEAAGQWVFVDAVFDPTEEEVVIGQYDFGGLLARIEHAVRSSGAVRVAVDSIGAVFTRFTDAAAVRRELGRLAVGLRSLHVTSLLTAERQVERGETTGFGVEEFVCDNVMILRNVLEEESRRRTIELLKLRGVDHLTGEFPFTIRPDRGIVVITLAGTDLTAGSSNLRISSGIAELDEMCGGGMFRDAITLVSGPTGTGKSLTVTEFIDGGIVAGERALIFAFEESRDQLFRNAAGWGRDFGAAEESGLLHVECVYPEMKSLEDHLVRIKELIDEFGPNRFAIDSLSALERISPPRSFREFLIGLTSYVKKKQVAAMFTSTTRSLMGGDSVTETHISTLTDMIILLRYVEMFGEVRRGLTVLKMRGSPHDKQIHEYTIDTSGLHIGAPFRDVTGILAGAPQHIGVSEIDRVSSLFRDMEGGPAGETG